MPEVFINSIGTFLPNNAIDNEEMEDFLGRINGKESRIKKRILDQNGIKLRYYALDRKQQSTHSNAQMASLAANTALGRNAIVPEDVQLISSGLQTLFSWMRQSPYTQLRYLELQVISA